MSELRLDDYLGHIEQAANEALDFTRGVTEDEFRTDLRTQRAVIMNLVVIGEAAVRIGEKYPDFVQQTPQIEWRSIRGMRNRIVHGYFDINLKTVWDTVLNRLPELIEQVAAVRLLDD